MAKFVVGIVVLAAMGVGAWLFLGGESSDPGTGTDLLGDGGGVTEDDEVATGLRGSGTGDAPLGEHASGQGFSRTVNVEVLREDDTPVAGAAVVVRWTGPTYQGKSGLAYAQWRASALEREVEALAAPREFEELTRVATDEAGKATIVIRREGAVSFRPLVAAPLVGPSRSLHMSNTSQMEQTLRLRVLQGVRVEGQVVGTGDKGIHAFVQIVRHAKPGASHGSGAAWSLAWQETDHEGKFVSHVPKGDASVHVHVPNQCRVTLKPFAAPSAEPWLLRVPMGASLTVTASNMEGHAVPDALVGVRLMLASDQFMRLVGRTDAAGQVTFQAGEGTVMSVAAQHASYVPYQASGSHASWAPLMTKVGADARCAVTLLRGGTVRGTVTASDGSGPIADAGINLMVSSTAFQGGGAVPPNAAVSGADGTYELTGVPPGRHVLWVTHEAWHHPALAIRHGGSQPPTELLVLMPRVGKTVIRDIQLAPSTSVRGIVIDAKDQPVSGATIVVQNASGAAQRLWQWGVSPQHIGQSDLGTSDGAGRFAISVPPSTQLRLGARSDRLVGTWSDELDASKPQHDVTLRVLPAATIEGQVVAGEDKEPVGGAHIWIQGSHPPAYASAAGSATSDSEGSFTMRGVAPGVATVSTHHGGQHVQVPIDNLKAGETRQGVVLQVAASSGHTLRGRVTDQDGMPYTGAVLYLQSSEGGTTHHLRTGSTGSFSQAGLSAGEYSLKGRDRKTVLATVTLPHEGMLEVETDAPPLRTLKGSIRDSEGNLIPAVMVKFGSGLSRRTYYYPGQQTGQLFMGGHYEVRARVGKGATLTLREARDEAGELLSLRMSPIPVPDDALERGQFDVVVKAGVDLILETVDEGGNPVPGVALIVRGARGGAFFNESTDSQGRYVRRGCDPNDSYYVGISPTRGWMTKTSNRTIKPTGEPIRIVMQRGGSIRGRAVTPEGEPARGRRVTVHDESGRGIPASASLTDAAGKFKIEGLELERSVFLRISSGPPHYMPGVVQIQGAAGTEVQVGEQDVEIVVHPTLEAKGRVLDEHGEPVKHANVRVKARTGKAVSMGRAAPDGTFTIRGLGTGAYDVSAGRQMGQGFSEPVIVRGGDTEVVLTLAAGVTLSGRLVGTKEGVPYFVEAFRDGDSTRLGRAGVGKDGMFKVKGLPGSSPVVLLARGGTQYGLLRGAQPGGSDAVVELREGGVVSGRVDNVPEDASQVWVMAHHSLGTYFHAMLVKGKPDFEVKGLPPGTVTLRVGISGRPTMPKKGDPIDVGTTGVVLDAGD